MQHKCFRYSINARNCDLLSQGAKKYLVIVFVQKVCMFVRSAFEFLTDWLLDVDRRITLHVWGKLRLLCSRKGHSKVESSVVFFPFQSLVVIDEGLFRPESFTMVHFFRGQVDMSFSIFSFPPISHGLFSSQIIRQKVW